MANAMCGYIIFISLFIHFLLLNIHLFNRTSCTDIMHTHLNYCLTLVNESLFTVHCSLFTVHCSLFKRFELNV